jgi:DnaJ-class molecular chaperone
MSCYWRLALRLGPLGEFPLHGMAAGASSQPSGGAPGSPERPGDQAPAGTPGTGENVCPRCGGSGRSDAGERCPECNGTGRVTTGIGGA